MKLNKEEREFLLSLINDYKIRNLFKIVFFDNSISFVNSLVRKLSSNKDKECKHVEIKKK